MPGMIRAGRAAPALSFVLMLVALRPLLQPYLPEVLGTRYHLAAIVSLLFLIRSGDAYLKSDTPWASLALCAILLLAGGHLAPLLGATIAALALLMRLQMSPGLMGAVLLSMPIVPSLNFYLSYPIRIATSLLAIQLIRLSGFPVELDGLFFRYDRALVMIDAPCSGLVSLWSGMLFAMGTAAILRMTTAGTSLLILASSVILFTGNVIRTVSLFFLEAGIIKMPPEAHSACGVFTFSACLPFIVAMALAINGKPRPPANRPEKSEVRTARDVAAAALALLLLITGRPHPLVAKTISANPSAVPWPAEFEGRPLTRLDLTARELRFAGTFPGDMARFTDGQREIVMRRVAQISRKLHPSSECFAANGYSMKPLPGRRDASGSTWGCFSATRDAESLHVCETITDSTGRSWSDVSGWFWSGMIDNTSGPWTAITIARRAERGSS